MRISNAFTFGQVVYLRTDTEQLPRLVIRIQILPSMGLMYCLSQGTEESWHYEIEITADRDPVLSLQN
jgi:hypothetical protein